MNNIKELEPGDMVEYILTSECGIISSITDMYVFVKFKQSNGSYSITSQACLIDTIKLIWKKIKMKFKKIQLTTLDKVFIKIIYTILNIMIILRILIWIVTVGHILIILIPFIILLCVYITFRIWKITL